MNDFEFKIKVLNTLIGHIGDRQSSDASTLRICAELRNLLSKFNQEDADGDIAKQMFEKEIVHPNTAYDRLVDHTCSTLLLARADVEREAFESAKFDYLEDDRKSGS